MAIFGSAAIGEDYAFLVGVENYGKLTGLNPLQYSEDDVEELAELLQESGFSSRNITVLTTTRGRDEFALLPTADNIERELGLIVNGLRSTDTLLLAFAGHGVKYRNDESSYFCPINVQIETRRNLVSFDDVYKQLRRCQAGRKFLLVDACRNDPLAQSSRSSLSVSRPVPVLPPSTTVALFACQAGQVAREDSDLRHGVFFHFILEGLRGQADQAGNNNQSVELDELVSYTSRAVTDHVRNEFRTSQIPELRINSSDLLTYRYPLLRKTELNNSSLGTDSKSQMNLVPSGDRLAGQIRADNIVGMKLVWCPPGRFTMGLPPGIGNSTGNDYGQIDVEHTVGFWIGETEVTQSQWTQVMSTTPWSNKKIVVQSPSRPATWISRTEAIEYCNRLTKIEREAGRLSAGEEYTLPSDAQWEFACRAGTTTAFSFGNDESELPQYAWFGEYRDSKEPPEKVALKRPNPWGLYDMHGNVGELCRGGFLKYSGLGRRKGGGKDPEISWNYDDDFIAVCGGDRRSQARLCHSSSRESIFADSASADIGFRVIRWVPAKNPTKYFGSSPSGNIGD